MIPERTGPTRTPPPGSRVTVTIGGENEWRETRVRPKDTKESTRRLDRAQRVELTILAAHDSIIDRAKVSYPVATWGGSPLEVAEKSYLLGLTSNGAVVTMPDGSAASVGATRQVLDEHPDFGQRDRVIDAVDSATLRVGAELPALEAVVLGWLWQLASLRDRGNADAYKVTVKLRTLRTTNAVEEAVFDVAVDMAKPASVWTDPSEKLRGTLVVRKAEAWPVAFDVEGSYKMGGVTLEGQLRKEGRRKLSIAWSYELPGQ